MVGEYTQVHSIAYAGVLWVDSLGWRAGLSERVSVQLQLLRAFIFEQYTTVFFLKSKFDLFQFFTALWDCLVGKPTRDLMSRRPWGLPWIAWSLFFDNKETLISLKDGFALLCESYVWICIQIYTNVFTARYTKTQSMQLFSSVESEDPSPKISQASTKKNKKAAQKHPAPQLIPLFNSLALLRLFAGIFVFKPPLCVTEDQ